MDAAVDALQRVDQPVLCIWQACKNIEGALNPPTDAPLPPLPHATHGMRDPHQARPRWLSPAAAPVPARRELLRTGDDFWTIKFDDKVLNVRDLQGMRHMARLLDNPGHDVHVTELMGLLEFSEPGTRPKPADGSHRYPDGHGQPGIQPIDTVIDRHALRDYRRRLSELEEELADAHDLHDDGRQAKAQWELEFLRRELSVNLGLDHKPRRVAPEIERARVSVTKSIWRSVDIISRGHEPLGRHLRVSINTGAYCSYRPESPESIRWTVRW
jgi:hypothetical protein